MGPLMAPFASEHPFARLAGRIADERFAAGLRRIVPAALDAVSTRTLGADERTVLEVARTGTRVGIAHVGPAGGPARAILLVAQTPAGGRLLRRRSAAQRRVVETPDLGLWASLVPAVLHEGEVEGHAVLLEAALPGRTPAPVTADTPGGAAILEQAAETIAFLHDATAREVLADTVVLDRWVRRPISIVRRALIAGGQGASTAPLLTLENRLVSGLLGRRATVGWIHGDLWTGNLLVDGRGTPTGIVDWDRAGPGDLAVHDLLHLLVYPRSRVEGVEPGAIVAAALRGAPWAPAEQAILGLAPEWAAGGPDDRRRLLLLYWLRFLAASMEQSDWFARHRGWVRENVDAVLGPA